MTATLTPPAPPAPVVTPRATGGGAPARRAIRRWAWRLLRREWRQQVLVLGLLTVAVAATTVGLGLVVNVQSGNEGVFGTARSRLDVVNVGAGGEAADLVAARQQFGTVEGIAHTTVPVPGSVTPVDLRDQDPHGVYGAPMLHVVSGRYPVGADEVAVTRAVAKIFTLTDGATWTVGGRALHVVGTVENPKDLQDAFGLVAPGQISAPSSITLLLSASGEQARQFAPPANGGRVQGISATDANSARQHRNEALAVLLLATIGLSFVGLLSVAGFTVMAQRRLRAFGMVGAIGATDRQVRRMMMSNGVAVGVVGAVVGTGVGLAGWFALTPAFERLVGHRYDALALPWWAVIACGGLAVLTAVAASWWPARSAARMPIVAALSGRPPRPQPTHRFAALGLGLAAAGFVMLVAANAKNHVLIVTGIVATTGGMLLLAPLGIRALASFAPRTPIATRLALRDLARYQARSGAALAAASLAIGIAATITISASAAQSHDHTLSGGNLPREQLIVWLSDPNKQGGPGMSVSQVGGPTGAPAVPQQAVIANARSTAAAIATALSGATVVELDEALDLSTPVPLDAPPDAAQANLVHPFTDNGARHGWQQVATPFVATPETLALYKVPAAAIAANADILTSRRDLGGAQLGSGFKGDFRDVTVQVSGSLPNYTSAPNTLVTPKAMTAGGYTAVPYGWLVQAAHPLTTAEIADARQRAAAAGIAIEVRTGPDDSLQKLRTYATLAGVLVALGVLAMTVGLIRSETAGDLRTLTAAGASGATRRMLNATSAGALALLGGLLGTATAYLALIAWHWRKVGYLSSPPYANLLILILGLPVLAVAAAWLLGRTPTGIARRSLD